MSLSGLFAINKPTGRTSTFYLNGIKRNFFKEEQKLDSTRNKKKGIKIGHGGTLDPLASGVLVIGINDGCKSLSKFYGCDKVYSATGLFGFATDTYDCQGEVIKEASADHITKENLIQAISKFQGEIKQLPPLYSALKMDGRRLYDYARKGQSLPREIEPRPITIHSISLLEFTTDQIPTPTASLLQLKSSPLPSPSSKHPIFKIHISCSGGTYIRSLVHDIGEALGSCAHVIELKRIQQGEFLLGRDTIEWDECSDINNIIKILRN
ncbi:10686_t:CDS:2 [Entrophospora sp. SA101]|nr:12023_t:CDS:2 [Entrophospora sp. SA101]CAJ0763136.1 10686_t:CDS:2 [Entrophospora sp. SA101]CAJ0905073.1 2357_t:CDS:2 [Entrophospora sp. SA101]